jgi:YVTN family beta-propeller protein
VTKPGVLDRSSAARRRARAAALVFLLLCACSPRAARKAGGPPPAATPVEPRVVGDAVVAKIPTRGFGTAIALSPDGTRAYVTVQAAVLVIDTAAGRVVRTIETGGTPHAIVLSRDGSRGFAVDLLQQDLWILDLSAARVSSRVPLGARSAPVLRPGVALSADGRTAYVTVSQPEGQGFDTIRMIDADGGGTKQRGLDFHPGALVVDKTGLLWITGCVGLCSDGTLHLIDPGGIGAIAKIDLPSIPGGIALSPGGRRAFVANGLAGSVSVFDVPTRSLVAAIPVGAEPLGVAASSDGRRAYVTTFQSGDLSAIDLATNQVVAVAALGKNPRAIAVSPDGRRAYVTHSSPVVSVVDLTRLGP